MGYNEPPTTTKGITMISYKIDMAVQTLRNATLTETQKKENFIKLAEKLDGYTPSEKELARLSFGGDGKHSTIANKIRAKLSK